MRGIACRVARAAVCLIWIFLFVCCVSSADAGLEGIEDLFGTDWYGLYLLGQKLGYGAIAFDATEFQGEKAYKLSFEMHAKFATMGLVQEVSAVQKKIYGADGRLKRLEYNVPQVMGQTFEFLGEVAGNKFRLMKKTAHDEQIILIDIPDETLQDALKEAAMINEDTKVGDSFTSKAYDPLLDEKKAVEAKSLVTAVEETVYNGVPTRVFRVETTMSEVGNIPAVSKVTPDGEIIETQFGGVKMRLETEDLAKDVRYVADTMVSSAIVTAQPITYPRDVTEMSVRIEGIPDDSLIMRDARQSYSLDVRDNIGQESADGSGVQPRKSYLLTVRQDDLDAVSGSTVPKRPGRFGATLEPSLFVQSDDPKIVQLAKRIVGDERDAVEVLKKLNGWVYRNIEKRFTATVSDALDTLARKSGDCTEHSVLFVALARAVGLPAREVSGLVYSEDGGGFFFHQWAEVYVGEWIATDPTFGQPVADATHIKLTEGELVKQMKIVGVIGRLRIEVVDVKHV